MPKTVKRKALNSLVGPKTEKQQQVSLAMVSIVCDMEQTTGELINDLCKCLIT